MKGIFWHAGAIILIVALMFTALPAGSVDAAIGPLCYVNDNASGGNNGNSWADAYTSLQSALADTNCTEIWVAAGVYYPGVSGLPNLTFQLKSGVAIYGGFNGTETSRDQRNWQVNKTILSGDIDKNDTNTDGNFIAETTRDIQGSNAYHVVTGSGTDNTAVLDGFIITAGQANQANPYCYGGGMYNVSGSPTLINLTFSGNSASMTGGGMYNNSGSPTLTNVIFSGNSVNGSYSYGGGMYNYSGSPTLTNVIFASNTVNGSNSAYGGGMYNANYSSPTLTNVIFAGNTVDSTYSPYGGGMVNVGFSSPTLTNVTFFGNQTLFKGSSGGSGGGMYNYNTSNPTLNNVILWGNTAANGPGIYNVDSTPTIAYSLLQESICPSRATCGSGMIYNTDPLFVDADGADNIAGTPDDNLHLQRSSPAIDAGNNSAVPAGLTTDLDGKLRFWDVPTVTDTGSGIPPIVDMGAYEVVGLLYAAPSAVGSGDCTSWANACTLQTALSGAASGDEIWVKEGVHYPGASGNRSASFQLKNSVAIYGGFAGTETQRSQRDWQTNKTILSGDIDQNDTNTDGNNIAETTRDIQGSNAYHVLTGSNTNNTAVLDGFIITAGQANGDEPDYSGGGMYNYSGSPTLTNLTFSGNTARYGGGMANNFYSSPTLTDVTFSGNSASSYGGGMDNNFASSPTLTNVTFSGNSAFNFGGGMVNAVSSAPMLTNVTFSGNTATETTGAGGGMYNANYSSPTLTNVILWANTATNGPGIYNVDSTPTVSNSDIEGCGGSGSWNSACGTDGGGNLDADPRFVNAANGNLRLNFGSPAIESGTNNNCPSTDLDGLPRPADGNGDSIATCDMGAYEAGTMICGLGANTSYIFDKNSNVVITTTVTMGSLDCLYVDEMETNHPNATPGIQTGRYWVIHGLRNDKQTNASDFTLTLTLPTTFTPDANDKVCRYTGSGQVWDCDKVSYTTNSITREGITALSEWAVGNDVGPTAVKLRDMRATSSTSPFAWLFPVALAIGLWIRKALPSC